jgi:multiple sugar transport system substrate-binding protein
MRELTRRDLLKAGSGLATLAAAGGTGLIGAAAQAQPVWNAKPEKGAEIRVLRWKQFVQGDIDLWHANTKRYTEQTGIKVRVDTESWEDVRPKAAVAANIGSGPDIIIGTNDDPHKFPDKLIDLTDLAEFLGARYGGWYDICRKYGTRNGRWIALPQGAPGACINYRDSHVKAAGFESVPRDLSGFLKLCKALKTKGTPAGFALGHATGDANSWTHWCLWAHGGKLVDERNGVAINSAATIAALDYAKELYQTFIPGTMSWLDPSNNKAFLDSQISLTSNGISIYYAAKTSKDATLQAMAKDIEHIPYPVGPAGRATQYTLMLQAFLFKYSKYPNAAKDYLRFMWEKDQYEPWQQASIGYVTQPLKAYEANPVWTSDPKHTPFRDAMTRTLDCGHAGSLGFASAAAMADFIVVDMFAEACSGAQTPKAAAERAEARAARYYKV